MKKILCVVGTRPEAIKMAPVILELKKESWADVRVFATAQHRDMLDSVLKLFNITPDIDLNIMRPNQDLTTLTARILVGAGDILKEERPDVVLVQGDTTTVMTVTLACFYQDILVGHVEAGLRTWDMRNPFPEEANRVITGKLAYWHFAPTEGSMKNLICEGIESSNIIVTGNTVIDALYLIADKNQKLDLDFTLKDETLLILVTVHRRENFGKPFLQICQAIKRLAIDNPDVQFIYPVHLNPSIRDIAYKLLNMCSNIHLTDPMNYSQFVSAIKRSYFIISDSGGVQEEAPSLGKPVLVLRNETERPEAVEQGVVKIVGSNMNNIVKESQRLLDDKYLYRSMSRGVSPYGDGHAAEYIVKILKKYFYA